MPSDGRLLIGLLCPLGHPVPTVPCFPQPLPWGSTAHPAWTLPSFPASSRCACALKGKLLQCLTESPPPSQEIPASPAVLTSVLTTREFYLQPSLSGHDALHCYLAKGHPKLVFKMKFFNLLTYRFPNCHPLCLLRTWPHSPPSSLGQILPGLLSPSSSVLLRRLQQVHGLLLLNTSSWVQASPSSS